MTAIPGSVARDRRGRVAVLTVDSPPGNALGHRVREGLRDAVMAASQDDAVGAIIWVHGYGWPVYRGGPMFWADVDQGLPALRDRMLESGSASGRSTGSPPRCSASSPIGGRRSPGIAPP